MGLSALAIHINRCCRLALSKRREYIDFLAFFFTTQKKPQQKAELRTL